MLREGDFRIPSGCAVSGFIHRQGVAVSGESIIRSIALMHDRSNGLGGGFAAYGIYPEFKNCYALHLFFEDNGMRKDTEEYLRRFFITEMSGPIPTRKNAFIKNAPLIWRYFVRPKPDLLNKSEMGANDFVVERVMEINGKAGGGAYVFSSGKNMGAFKGVGYAEDIGDFYRLDEYGGYCWTAHGRFPTNTPGWWGGAHPFTLLDWSVVHNGEISSYDANRRYLEMFNYRCTLQTDTEAIAYIFDLLVRRHGLTLDLAAAAVTPPFWSEIDRMPTDKKELYRAARIVYAGLLINGPFSIILGFTRGMLALNDRIKLRPLTAAEKGDILYVASEESAIREICPQPDRVWMPRGGEPVYGRLADSVLADSGFCPEEKSALPDAGAFIKEESVWAG